MAFYLHTKFRLVARCFRIVYSTEYLHFQLVFLKINYVFCLTKSKDIIVASIIDNMGFANAHDNLIHIDKIPMYCVFLCKMWYNIYEWNTSIKYECVSYWLSFRRIIQYVIHHKSKPNFTFSIVKYIYTSIHVITI